MSGKALTRYRLAVWAGGAGEEATMTYDAKCYQLAVWSEKRVAVCEWQDIICLRQKKTP